MRYTAVFEFNEEPTIKKNDNWLGGKLCVVNFSDVFVELEKLRLKMDLIQNWYDTDGSVGGLSQIMDDDV